jgi:hypothetical protein
MFVIGNDSVSYTENPSSTLGGDTGFLEKEKGMFYKRRAGKAINASLATR